MELEQNDAEREGDAADAPDMAGRRDMLSGRSAASGETVGPAETSEASERGPAPAGVRGVLQRWGLGKIFLALFVTAGIAAALVGMLLIGMFVG